MEVSVNHLTFAYHQQPILKDLSFSIKQGDFLTILGPNGVGKSTLIKCLIGLNPVMKNTIYFNNQDCHIFKQYHSIGYVPQRAHYLNFEIPMTVSELLQTASIKKVTSAQKLEALQQVNMQEHLNVTIKKLSGGQLQRVLIARSLIAKPSLLILDEPTVGVDAKNLAIFFESLRQLKAQGMTIILITHDPSFLALPNTHVLTLGYLTHTFETIESYEQTHCGGGCRS